LSKKDAFVCGSCGKPFTVPPAARKKFPGWTPRTCMDCRFKSTTANTDKAALAALNSAPDTGVFTDGSSDPNPGPGGWGAVKVVDGEVVAERAGHDPKTTNNRMELTALIEGYKMLEPRDAMTVYSDSEYCVRIINEWAEMWEANGWRRGKRREHVENLDLVKELYAITKTRPLARAEWIRGHAGARWNEHADMLSRRYMDGGMEGEHRPAPDKPKTLPML
jgi:ribonuclease HI